MAEGRGGWLGSLLQARYTKPFDRLYIVHPVPRIFSFFFFSSSSWSFLLDLEIV